MKTTVTGLIKRHLIKVCKEKTQLMRDRIDLKQKKQFSNKKIDAAVACLRNSFTPEGTISLLGALSALFDAPELRRTIFDLELLGVVVLEKNPNQIPYSTDVPWIISRTGAQNRCFYTDGHGDVGYAFGIEHDPRPATDEEIVQCIENLTEKQWSAVLNPSSPLFVPIIKDALANEVEVVETPLVNGEAKAGAEIETNGRRITIGKE